MPIIIAIVVIVAIILFIFKDIDKKDKWCLKEKQEKVWTIMM